MRKLSYEYRIPSRSLPEVYEPFMAALAKYQRGRSLQFNGRKLSAEAMLNGLVMYFLSLPESEQRRALEFYVPQFEAMLSGSEVEAPSEEPPKNWQILEVKEVTGENLFRDAQELPVKRVERRPKSSGTAPKRRKGAG